MSQTPNAIAMYPSRACHVRPASTPTVSSITRVAASRTSSTCPRTPLIGRGFGLVGLETIDQDPKVVDRRRFEPGHGHGKEHDDQPTCAGLNQEPS